MYSIFNSNHNKLWLWLTMTLSLVWYHSLWPWLYHMYDIINFDHNFIIFMTLFTVIMYSTGWSIITVKEYELIAQARKQPIRGIRCHFVHQIGTFWYLVSKKFHNCLVIIHLSRLLSCITVEICKIHWELMIS